jgi:hypothetical protein
MTPLIPRVARAYSITRDPYTTAQRQAWHEREIARQSAARRAEIDRLEAAGYGREIAR